MAKHPARMKEALATVVAVGQPLPAVWGFFLLYTLFRGIETAPLERCSLEESFAECKKVRMGVEHRTETFDAGETAQSTC